jgi:hypothetical protein
MTLSTCRTEVTWKHGRGKSRPEVVVQQIWCAPADLSRVEQKLATLHDVFTISGARRGIGTCRTVAADHERNRR